VSDDHAAAEAAIAAMNDDERRSKALVATLHVMDRFSLTPASAAAVAAELFVDIFLDAGKSFTVAARVLRESWMAVEADREAEGAAILKPKGEA
jgi:hypothetical protein